MQNQIAVGLSKGVINTLLEIGSELCHMRRKDLEPGEMGKVAKNDPVYMARVKSKITLNLIPRDKIDIYKIHDAYVKTKKWSIGTEKDGDELKEYIMLFPLTPEELAEANLTEDERPELLKYPY